MSGTGGRRPVRRLGAVALAAAALLGPAAVADLPKPPSSAPLPERSGENLVLSSDLRIRVRSGRHIELEVRRIPGGTFASVAQRVCGSAELGDAVAAWNAGGPADEFVRVPLAFLSDEFRSLVLLDLFPQDRREGDDWLHVAKGGAIATYDEGLWQIAEWFTGDGKRFEEVQRANGLPSPEVAGGSEVRIPGRLLHRSLAARGRSEDGQLVYGTDAAGPFAGYRLKPGEALWSSVVIRFTGRTAPEDVTAIAESVARRSGIPDLTDIPVNYLVKVPLDVLEPEFLPAGDPRRREAEAVRAEVEAEIERKPVAKTRGGLRGVIVVLDAGHGGRDLGTINHGIWEHDYVYDVACRLKRMIEGETTATVLLTLEDMATGCTPSVGDALTANRQGTVRSSPPFLADDDGESSTAVHLRWYVANSMFRKAVRQGTDPDRVVFLSLHADSRHAALRGLMAYVPGARHRIGSYGPLATRGTRFTEVREAPRVKLTRAQRIRAEAVSRRLATSIVRSFGAASLPLQAIKPIRNEVIRGGGKWVPAVLRGNAIPASVLVELVNLGNREDAALLAGAPGRERMARSLYRSLFAYFGEDPSAEPAASR